MVKKIFTIIVLTMFCSVNIFAESLSELKKKLQDTWNSQNTEVDKYSIEIDETTFKYNDKKTKEYLTWSYECNENTIFLNELLQDKSKFSEKSKIEKNLSFQKNKFNYSFNDDNLILEFSNGEKILLKEDHTLRNTGIVAGAAAAIIGGILLTNSDCIMSKSNFESLSKKAVEASKSLR